MASFAYTAVDPSGAKRTGTIDAPDQQTAIRQITQQGRFVLEINESKGVGAAAKPIPGGHAHKERKKRGASKSDLALFTRRLADLSSAGLPLDRTLEVLAEQSESQPICSACLAALEEVRGGLPVSESLSHHPKLFPPLVTQTLAAGEASGQFPQSATRLADMQEKDVARRSQVVSALVYPAVLLVTALGVVVFLLTFVVPKLQGVFDKLGGELPAPTQVLVGITAVFTQYWMYLIGGIVALVIGYRVWVATPQGAYSRDKFMMYAPVFGKVIRQATISRYARVLGTLVYGGVPILDALRLAGLAAGNRVFIERGEVVGEEVREGRPIAEAMQEAGGFPPVLVHMTAIGEETGDLPSMLTRVADSLDFEVEQNLRRATAALEPLIVLAMGAFIAFVVISIMLPIYQTQELVK